jgi:tetratricopeptide (TPR) repeat protein
MSRHHRRRARRRRRLATTLRMQHATAPPEIERPFPFELVDPEPSAAADSRPPDASVTAAEPLATTTVPLETPAEAEAPTLNCAEVAEEVVFRPLSGDEVLYRAAQEAAQRGDAVRALAIYRELLVEYPGHVAARSSFALLLDRVGQHDTALAELDLCLEHAPDDAGALIRRGTLRSSLGLFAQAETDLRHALRVDPANPDGHLTLGLVLSRKGLWREAIPHLRRVVEVDPSRATAWDALGEALNHVDELDGALQAFQRSAELRPTNSRALRGLGVVYDRLNRPREAAAMYRRSRELTGT